MSSAAPFSGRLGPQHFAHLRAVAEGVSIAEAARRYLLAEQGALEAHRLVVDRVRAIAHRRGDPRWRLVGIEIRDPGETALPPPIDEWAESQGLQDWSAAELQEMYAERFGSPEDPRLRRRHARNARLRERRIALLRELEGVAFEPARSSDPIEGWFPPELAAQLRQLGMLTLADLRQRIHRGGRWWLGLRAYGPLKARRLAENLQLILPAAPPGPAATSWPLVLETGSPGSDQPLARFSGSEGKNRVQNVYAGTDAGDDRQAIAAWIVARAKSAHTKKQYAREAERFVLWCVLERGRAMSDATAEDCAAYMEFITNVPPAWISRANVGRLSPRWAPFRGSLTVASQQLALAALHSLFSWLVQARYLASNPWVLVNRKLGDDPRGQIDVTGSRAFTPAAWAAMMGYLDRAPVTPSIERLRWICAFTEATGLRAAELLGAKVGDLKQLPAGWVLRVHGKGRRNRTVPVPSKALSATAVYLAGRGTELKSAGPDTPLLGSLRNPGEPVTYSALHQTLTRFLRQALSTLAPGERRQFERASAHWLRHTHATRAAEQQVPLDVLQENLGQSDPRTTARYYRAQLERRQREMERVYGAAPEPHPKT